VAAAGIGWRTLAADESLSGSVEDSPPPSLTVLLHAGVPSNETNYAGDDTGHSCMRSGDVSGEVWNILYGPHHKSTAHIQTYF